MPRGSVTVDLAAAAGGNIETTKPGEVIKHNDVTCIGYTNMESRMANTASTLFSGNVTNFLLSMEDEEKKWHVNLDDPAVRSVCVSYQGKKLEPYAPPPPPASAAKPREEEEAVPEDPRRVYLKSAFNTTAGTTTALALASYVPNAPMMSTFALSCWVGNSCVKGVSHSLHSPLMAMTNAISGMTIVGGMLQLGKVSPRLES